MPGGGIDFNVQPGPGLLLGLDPEYQLNSRKVAATDAFKDGLPTTDGTPNGPADYGAMARKYFQLGAFEPGKQLLDVGIQQQQLKDASQMTGALSRWFAPASSNAPAPAGGSGGAGFDPSVNFTLKQEGGLNPKDTNGSPTNFGINAAANPGVDVAHLTQDGAKSIYRSKYWDAIGGDNLPPPLQTAVFDSAVMMGPERAKTLLAQSGGDPQKFMDLREGFLGDLLSKNPEKYGKYASAWSSRNAALRQTIGGAPAAGPAAPASADQPAAAPVQVAENGASDAPPSSTHPYAPSAPPKLPAASAPAMPPAAAPAAPSQPTPIAAPAMAMASPVAALPQPQGMPAAPPQTAPAPMPQQFAPPPPLSPNAGAPPAPLDPTFGGQVPAAWLKAGHSAGDWVNYARAMAGLSASNPYAKGAGEQWSKIADGLSSSIDKSLAFTPEQKNARDPVAVGYEHTKADYAAAAKNRAKYLPDVIQGAATLAQAQEAAKLTAENDPTAVAARSANAASVAEATQSGEALGKLPTQLATAADGARSQNAMVDAMLDAGSQFDMGKFADKEQAFNATVSALGHKLGVDTSSIDGKTATYQEFAKLAGQFSRQAMKDAGGRAGGIQELQFITNTLPSPTMSPDGFRAVANQLKGLGDFNMAKQQAAETYGAADGPGHGSLKGFDANWNKNVTPAAFVMHRMQVDQPQVFSQTVSRLAQSPQGRATLQSIRSGLSWAGSNGLLN